jgi:hypothetical protein
MPLTIRTASTVGGGGCDTTAVGDHREYPDGVSSSDGGSGDGGDGTYETSGQTAGPEQQDGGGSVGESQNSGGAGGAETETEGPEPSDDVTEPMSTVCTRDMLGNAETVTQEPDSEGQIYGSFRMVNVSDQPCVVEGSGEMAVAPLDETATTGADVQVVEQTDEGEATALPEAAEAVEQLLLEPGAAYEVMFAYVPEDGETGGGCVQSGPTDSPSPDPTDPTSGTGEPTTGTDAGGTSDGTMDQPAQDTDGGTGGDTGDGGENSGGEGDGGSGDETGGDSDGGENSGGDEGTDSGVVLMYTPDAGEPPAAEIQLPGVCSGTVYRTDALPAETA